jgi:hypothetical protein
MLMVNAFDAEAPPLSFTWMTGLNTPTSVGFPEIVPVEGDKVRPLGSRPLETDQVYGGVPPVACNVELYAVCTWPAGRLVVAICKGCAFTVSVAALLVLLPATFVTTTVNCAPLSELVVAAVV